MVVSKHYQEQQQLLVEMHWLDIKYTVPINLLEKRQSYVLDIGGQPIQHV
jgi:hypothetical protein